MATQFTRGGGGGVAVPQQGVVAAGGGQPAAVGAEGGGAQVALRHGQAVRDLAFHPTDPSLLASASDDSAARVWTLDLDGQGLARLEAGAANPGRLPRGAL